MPKKKQLELRNLNYLQYETIGFKDLAHMNLVQTTSTTRSFTTIPRQSIHSDFRELTVQFDNGILNFNSIKRRRRSVASQRSANKGSR